MRLALHCVRRAALIAVCCCARAAAVGFCNHVMNSSEQVLLLLRLRRDPSTAAALANDLGAARRLQSSGQLNAAMIAVPTVGLDARAIPSSSSLRRALSAWFLAQEPAACCNNMRCCPVSKVLCFPFLCLLLARRCAAPAQATAAGWPTVRGFFGMGTAAISAPDGALKAMSAPAFFLTGAWATPRPPSSSASPCAALTPAKVRPAFFFVAHNSSTQAPAIHIMQRSRRLRGAAIVKKSSTK